MIYGQIILVAFVIFLALWRRDIFFYFCAFPAAFTFGLMWRSRYPEPDGFAIAAIFIGIGVYCFVMGIYNLLRKAKIMGD